VFSKAAHVRDTIKASVAIAVCLTILGAFVVVLGGYRFWEELEVYNIRFRSVKDLSPGRPVKYGGLDVGRILAIGVDQEDPTMIRVSVGLDGRVPMRQGVVARIAQKGLVGDYYVFLDPQSKLGEVIPPGAFIPSVETVDLSQLAGMAGEVLMELRPRLERIAMSLETVLTSENSARITELLAKAPKLVSDLQAAVDSVKADFKSLTATGKSVANDASRTLNTIDKAVESLRIQLDATLTELRKEVKQVGALAGNLDKAVKHDQEQLEDILHNVERLSADLKNLASRLRERPWEILRKPTEHLR
jgi:phospholipid/cholesterol/gamma-HCH transport system substrate-binding protein